MPLPTPSKGENRSKFMSRCMGNPTMKSDFSKQKQRLAVCFSQWRKGKSRDELLRIVPMDTTSANGFAFKGAGNGTLDGENFIMQLNQAGDVAVVYKDRKAVIELNSIVASAVEMIEEQIALEALKDEEEKEVRKDNGQGSQRT